MDQLTLRRKNLNCVSTELPSLQIATLLAITEHQQDITGQVYAQHVSRICKIDLTNKGKCLTSRIAWPVVAPMQKW
jgi:hypothetical protein